jgi:hypothetical protein
MRTHSECIALAMHWQCYRAYPSVSVSVSQDAFQGGSEYLRSTEPLCSDGLFLGQLLNPNGADLGRRATP